MNVRRWYHSNILKVAFGWTLLIGASLGTFVLARNNVLAKRKEQMQVRRKIKEEIEREAEK